MQRDDAYLLNMLLTARVGDGIGTPRALAARLPEAAHAVAVEEGFVGDEHEIARQRLGDEHAIERVAVVARQRAGPGGVVHGYGKVLEALARERSGNVRSHRRRARQFAKPVFRGNLPSGRRAHQHVVLFIVD